MNQKLLSIGETAKIMNISIDTLRRWDKTGRLLAIRQSGKRYYKENDINDFLAQKIVSESALFSLANTWVSDKIPNEAESFFYCPNSLIFQARLTRLENNLSKMPELKDIFPLITAISGEIGNNSYDHNLGSWPDIPGIFFGYDLEKREVVLADRGQGILKTLKRVKPELSSDEEALKVAFTEIISGRAPEARGNGLKFVRRVITNNDLKIIFQSGTARLDLQKDTVKLNIVKQKNKISGCIALINF